jgi:hypothetical protein
MVHGDEQRVLVIGHANEAPADERSVFQIEGLVDFVGGDSLELAVCIRLISQVVYEQEQEALLCRGNLLGWHTIDKQESGAQSFMAKYDPIQRLTQGGLI